MLINNNLSDSFFAIFESMTGSEAMRKMEWSYQFTNLFTNGLRSKLSNHSCYVIDSRKVTLTYPGATAIIYTGSIDPGTIKSKYIPTVLSINKIVMDMFKGNPKYKVGPVKKRAFPITSNYRRSYTLLNDDYLAFDTNLNISELFDPGIKWVLFNGGRLDFLVKEVGNNNRGFDSFKKYINYYVPEEVVNFVKD